MTLRASGTALVLACLLTIPLPAWATPTHAPSPEASAQPASQSPPASETAATPAKLPNAPAPVGVDEFGRIIGYLTLFAAIAAVAVYFAKYGFPFSKKSTREDRKLQILEMRPLGNRQFLLVVAYEETRILLGVTPGKIDYLCPLDATDSPPRDFSALLTTEKSGPGAT